MAEKKTKVIIFSAEGKVLFNTACVRVDITDNESIFYIFGERSAMHLPWSIYSTNVERGIITVYYINNSYAVLTNQI